MLKIVADENIPGAQDAFLPLGTVETVCGRSLHKAQLSGADILLVRSVTDVDERLLSGTCVKFVGSATSGLDHVDRNYLQRAGIAFASAPGANANSVVEYVLCAIAASGEHLESLLAGGSLGIAGYGAVGRLLETRLKALGITACVYDPWLDQSVLPHGCSLEEVLACDVISLHTSLTDDQPWPSRHLIGEPQLRCIRKDSLLVNASRGAVVDNHALNAALANHAGPQVILDVWEGEPNLDTDLLARVAIATSHIAGYSFDAKLRGTAMLLKACIGALGLPESTRGAQVADSGDIHLPASMTRADTARHLLRQRYDILQDDSLLRRALTQSMDGGTAAAFDRLRREYRVRRELAGSRVTGAAITPEQAGIASALGCIVGGIVGGASSGAGSAGSADSAGSGERSGAVKAPPG